MKDNNIYFKNDNGRYTPIGVLCNKDYMYDGLWYVKHKNYGRSITSCEWISSLFKVADADKINMSKLCGMEDLTDYIIDSDEFRDVVSSGKGYSLSDIVHICVKKLVEKAEEDEKL